MSEIDMEREEMEEGRLLSADFGLSVPPAAAEDASMQTDSGKTPDILAAEIRTIKSQTGRMVLNASIEVGRRLTEAKAKLPHGSWGEYLKNEVDYSPSQAQNLMRVFREYGSDQQSLFGGEAKSQTFGHLTFSQAVILLKVPDEDEREKFVLENDVEHMSVRELNEALKAREEALEAAAAAQDEAQGARREADRLREELAGQAQVYKAKLTSAEIEAKQAREAQEKAAAKAQRLQDALSEANTSAQAAEAEHAKMLQELEELRSRPAEMDAGAVEAARQAAISEMTEKVDKAKEAKKQAEEKRKAAEESLEAAQKELAELKAKGPEVRELTQEEKDALTAEAVNQARAEGAEQIRSLEKKLAAADPDVAEFKVRWNAWREEYRSMMEVLDRIARDNEDQAAKLRQAVKAALEQMA